MVISEGLLVYLAPDEAPAFFERVGWKPLDVRSLLHAAATLKRLPWHMRLVALLPDSKGRVPNSPWGGVCLFGEVREAIPRVSGGSIGQPTRRLTRNA